MEQQLKRDYESTTGSDYRDGLTGLLNNGFFQLYLDQELRRYERYGDYFTLAFINVDSFAQFNASKGSVKGDLLLKEIAGIIKDNIRQSDLGARYSGDIFAVIMTKSDVNDAFTAAERIKENVATRYNQITTVSIGLVSCPEDGTNKGTLIAKAQEALLKAKIRGKNRIEFFEQDTSITDDEKPKVLVVDDDLRNLKLMEAMLIPLDFDIIKASSGVEALSIVEKIEIDLILLDIMMPVMNGFEVCRRLKGKETTRLIPVVIVTALDDMDSKLQAIDAGADDILVKPPNKIELLARTKSLTRIRRLNKNLTSIENVIFSLANTVEAKDPYTQGHVERVSSMAVGLGRKLGLSNTELDALRLGGALHDIGKVAISSSILNKPGPLDAEEWKIMKQHTELGYKICKPLESNLGLALQVIRYHHEKLDGSGYPAGLVGSEIPTVAQVMAVVDIFDAMITDRPYRKGMDKVKVISILREEGAQGKLEQKIIEYLIEMIE